MSQADLANEIGVHRNTIADIERGVSEGWADTREAIAKALSCSVGDLYGAKAGVSSSPEQAVLPTDPNLGAIKAKIDHLQKTVENLQQEPKLTDDEKKLIYQFRRLNSLWKAAALTVIYRNLEYFEMALPEMRRLAKENPDMIPLLRKLGKVASLKEVRELLKSQKSS